MDNESVAIYRSSGTSEQFTTCKQIGRHNIDVPDSQHALEILMTHSQARHLLLFLPNDIAVVLKKIKKREMSRQRKIILPCFQHVTTTC